MKKIGLNEITLMQYIFFIHCIQIGVGQLSLPRLLAEKGGTDSWMSLLIGWAASVIASLLIVQAMKAKPDGTLIDLLDEQVGRWAGRCAAVAIGVYFYLYAATVILESGLIIKGWIMPRTPLYVFMALFSIPSYLIAKNGFRVLGRYAELVFFMFLPLSAFLFVPLREGHLLHLLPLIKEGWVPILNAVPTTLFSFAGFEIAFVVYPFLQRKEKAALGIIIANTLSLVVFLIITLCCFLYFSPDEITTYNQPTLTLLKGIEFKFIERLEIVFLSVYLFMISTSWIPMLTTIGLCVNNLVGKSVQNVSIAVMLAIVIAVSWIWDPSFNQTEQLMKVSSYSTLCFGYVFPIVLLLYLWIRKRSGRRKTG